MENTTLLQDPTEDGKCDQDTLHRRPGNNHLTDSFSIKSGIKQGCILSPFLFILTIDWLMTEITKDGNMGIRWMLTSILEELDYADDIGLLSSRHKDMQEKMDKLTKTAPQIGLKLNTN